MLHIQQVFKSKNHDSRRHPFFSIRIFLDTFLKLSAMELSNWPYYYELWVIKM